MSSIIFSEASGLADSIYGKCQAPIRLLIEKRGEAFEQSSALKDVFAIENSTHWGETYTSVTAMDGFYPVGENGAYPGDTAQEGFKKIFEHMTWKDKFAISREMIEDSKLIDMKKKPLGFIQAYYRTREDFGAALLGGAVSGNASLTYRGKSFSLKGADDTNLFSASHPAKVSGAAQTNRFAGAFSASNLSKLEQKMQQFKGDNGEILDICPDTIVIPNDATLKSDVFAAIGADKDPGGSGNGFNFQFGRWRVVVWNYLNSYVSGSPWILLDSTYNKDCGTCVWLDRTKLDVSSSVDEDNDANVWRGYSRFSAGFNDWRGIAVAGISGGSSL